MTTVTKLNSNRAAIKTLHITNYYHATSGGIRTFYRAMLEAANRHRREMVLVVPGASDTLEMAGEFGRVYTIGAPRSPFFNSSYRLLLPHLYALPYRSRLREILRSEQPDLIEICDKYTLCFLPAVLRKGWISGLPAPVVVGLSCERMDDNVSAYLSSGKIGRRWSQWYMQRVYAPLFDGHISNSDYTAQELWNALGPSSNLSVRVCPMGVETSALSPNRRSDAVRRDLLARFSMPFTESTRVLLYAGRVAPEKNIPLLLEMMEVLAGSEEHDYRLLIAGSGPKLGPFVEEARRRVPGRVHALGAITDRSRLADIYANCDAMIHPNPREPFGIGPLEAMASGLPVVAPRRGGVLTYANDRNAWLAEPSGECFAASVRDIFADDAARLAKIARALETVKEYSWEIITDRFYGLYDDLFARLAARTLRASGGVVTQDGARQGP